MRSNAEVAGNPVGEAVSFPSLSTQILGKLTASPTARAKGAADRAAEVRRVIAILHKWGIHTLGQFAALDKEQVSNRLGPEAVRMWERASGKATRLLKLVQPPESFAEEFEFENEIETSAPLLFMLQRFLQQFSVRLGALYLVAKELKLRITFSDPPPVRHRTDSSDWRNGSAAADKNSYEHVFKIPEPSNNIEVLFRMLHTHLENFTSPAPIVAVALEAEPTKPGQQQFSLFETALRDPTQLSETLARLIGLLGADRVGTPVLEETHRPDAFRIEPFSWQWQLPNETGDKNGASFPLARRQDSQVENLRHGLRRFRSAVAASVLLEKDKPMHLRSAESHGAVVDKAGPYLASGNWWDENAWQRAEWDLQLANGALCRCHSNGEAWQLDGIYD